MVNVFVYVHKSVAAPQLNDTQSTCCRIAFGLREMGPCLLLNQTFLNDPPHTHKHSLFGWQTRTAASRRPRPPPVIAIKMCSVTARVQRTTEGLTGRLLALTGKRPHRRPTRFASIPSAALNHRNVQARRWKANMEDRLEGTISLFSYFLPLLSKVQVGR